MFKQRSKDIIWKWPARARHYTRCQTQLYARQIEIIIIIIKKPQNRRYHIVAVFVILLLQNVHEKLLAFQRTTSVQTCTCLILNEIVHYYGGDKQK